MFETLPYKQVTEFIQRTFWQETTRFRTLFGKSVNVGTIFMDMSKAYVKSI